MTKFAAVFCLLLLAVSAKAAPPLSLSLPSADTYSYWVQSKSGPVGTMPVTVTGKKTIQIAVPMTAGDKLFVLDAHTGEMASRPISVGPRGVPVPAAFVLADFQPVGAPAPAVPSPIPASSPAAPVKQDAPPDKPNVAQRLLTSLFSLLLLGGVVWLITQLIKTRGEPLRQIARRVGVEVADPNAVTPAEAAAEPPVYTPQKRAPETVPEEAGLPPTTASLGRGPALPLSDIPALHGLQGLAAGSTFALTGGDVTVGRDGDNGIVLAENTVSRRHARLLRDGEGQFTLTDLDSANGVYINGSRVQRAVLASGDEIKIGDNYFRFQAAKENP